MFEPGGRERLQSPVLSVLIVNWNTRELLRACLRSLAINPYAGPSEILVVDNDSQDGSAEMVREEFPEARLILPGRNTGYARGNNLAFADARGEWLLTLNPDTEVPAGALDAAVRRLEELPGYGCLAPCLRGPAGEVQASVRGFPTVLGILGDLTGLGRRFPGSVWDSYRLTAFDYANEQDAPQPMGSFLLFRRQALEAVGDAKQPFDEGFPIFFNEVDLLHRLHEAGWKTRYCPDIEILHHGGMGTRQVRKSMIWESHRSLGRYLRKHAKGFGNAVAADIVSAIVLLGAFVRARGYHAGFRP